jgi:hypothetical protein
MLSGHYVSQLPLQRDRVTPLDHQTLQPTYHPIDRLALHPSVTSFIGENGDGLCGSAKLFRKAFLAMLQLLPQAAAIVQ